MDSHCSDVQCHVPVQKSLKHGNRPGPRGCNGCEFNFEGLTGSRVRGVSRCGITTCRGRRIRCSWSTLRSNRKILNWISSWVTPWSRLSSQSFVDEELDKVCYQLHRINEKNGEDRSMESEKAAKVSSLVPLHLTHVISVKACTLWWGLDGR